MPILYGRAIMCDNFHAFRRQGDSDNDNTTNKMSSILSYKSYSRVIMTAGAKAEN